MPSSKKGAVRVSRCPCVSRSEGSDGFGPLGSSKDLHWLLGTIYVPGPRRKGSKRSGGREQTRDEAWRRGLVFFVGKDEAPKGMRHLGTFPNPRRFSCRGFSFTLLGGFTGLKSLGFLRRPTPPTGLPPSGKYSTTFLSVSLIDFLKNR